MNKYLVKSIDHRTKHIVLTITPKSESDEIDFEAGQYATIGFYNNGRPSPMRCFSLVGSPRSAELQFAMRPYGRFTSKVANLSAGDTINVQGPFGDFVIEPENDKNIVMIAAGIGITPFMSMLRFASETKLPNPITLLYANRNTEEIPFENEIRELERSNPNLRVVFAVDKGLSDQTRRIYAGRIDNELLKQVTGNKLRNSTYFICGPQPFMNIISRGLRSNLVDESRIITESFAQKSTFGWKLPRLSVQTLTYATTAVMLAIVAGTVSIFDLWHYVPKATAAANAQSAATANQTTATNPQTTTSEDTTTATQPVGSYTTPSTSSSAAQTAPASTTDTSQSYIAPVSTVS